MTNPRSIPKTNWPWPPPGHTTSGAGRTGECNRETSGLPYPAFRWVNAEPGGGKPSPYKRDHDVGAGLLPALRQGAHEGPLPFLVRRQCTRRGRQAVPLRRKVLRWLAPRFIGAAIFTDRTQGPRTYNIGPRYSQYAGAAQSRRGGVDSSSAWFPSPSEICACQCQGDTLVSLL
jgi:hypothetical protein